MNVNERLPVNHRIGKAMYGAIHKNQRWKKRDTGRVMTVITQCKNNTWRCIFDGDSRGMRSHAIKEHDIYRFYQLL